MTTALLPYLVHNYENPCQTCRDAADNIAQVAGEYTYICMSLCQHIPASVSTQKNFYDRMGLSFVCDHLANVFSVEHTAVKLCKKKTHIIW